MTAEQREHLVSRVLSDPPTVHALDGEGVSARMGVWRTADSCYDFLCRVVRPGDRTLETGLGLSTALFAALGAEHRCVVSVRPQADRLVEYCHERGIPTDALHIVVGFSDEVLPTLDPGPLDLVLIDGGHGFPTPMIDWHYGTRTLRIGGLVVIDDIYLPAVHVLRRFLDADPRWQRESLTQQWAAFRRIAATGTAEDWWQQRWLPMPPASRARALLRRIRLKVGLDRGDR